MKSRLPAAALAAVLLGGGARSAGRARRPSTTVVISKIMTRGPAGGNDEVIEIKNMSTAPVAIGGWQLWGSNASGSAQSARATITAGRRWPPGRLPAHEQPGHARRGGNQTYSTGIADDGGLQLRSSAAATP